MNLKKYNTQQEIDQRLDELNKEDIQFNKVQKEIEKEITGKLWLWFFFPILGLIIYLNLTANRRNSDKYKEPLIKIKTELARNELERIALKQKVIREYELISE